MKETIQDLKTENIDNKENTSRGNYRNRNHEKTIRNHKCMHKEQNTRAGRKNPKY